MMHTVDRKPKVYLYGRNRIARIIILVSYCVQIAKCRVLENFQGLKVRGRGLGQRLVNWSSRILVDEDFRRGQQLCFLATWLCLMLYIVIFIVIMLSQINFFFFYCLIESCLVGLLTTVNPCIVQLRQTSCL